MNSRSLGARDRDAATPAGRPVFHRESIYPRSVLREKRVQQCSTCRQTRSLAVSQTLFLGGDGESESRGGKNPNRRASIPSTPAHHMHFMLTSTVSMTRSSLNPAPAINAFLLVLLCCGVHELHGFVASPLHPPAQRLPSSSRRSGDSAEMRQHLNMCGETATPPASATAVVPDAGRKPTWSNRGGLDLLQVSSDVWCAERPFMWNGIDVGE